MPERNLNANRVSNLATAVTFAGFSIKALKEWEKDRDKFKLKIDMDQKVKSERAKLGKEIPETKENDFSMNWGKKRKKLFLDKYYGKLNE